MIVTDVRGASPLLGSKKVAGALLDPSAATRTRCGLVNGVRRAEPEPTPIDFGWHLTHGWSQQGRSVTGDSILGDDYARV